MSAKLNQKGIPESEIVVSIRESSWGFTKFRKNFASLFDLVEKLEPFRAKSLGLRKIENHPLGKIIRFYLWTHSIVRWKRILVYVFPELHREFIFVEIFNRILCPAALYVCDRMHILSRDQDLAVIAGVLVFDEIQHLTKMEKPDPSAVDHVLLALKARLTVLCSRIFDLDDSTSKRKVSVGLTMMINRVPELSFCLPPACRNIPDTWKVSPWGFLPFYIPATPLDLPECLQSRSDSSDYYYDDRQTNSCCCGWAFDSTPPFLLSLFGHSAQTFARYIHSGPRKISPRYEHLALDTRQAINTIFEGPWSDDSNLRKSMIIFSSILSFSLWRFLSVLDFATERPSMDPEMAFIKDRLDRIAEHCRPQFFDHLLWFAVFKYRRYRNSEAESETEGEQSKEVWNQVHDWVLKTHESEDRDFVFGVLDILNSSFSAVANKSDDPDLSSD